MKTWRLAGIAALIATQGVCAQTKKQDAIALLNKASNATSSDLAASQPFHLRLKIKSYSAKGKALEGTYESWRARPDLWRLETVWEDKKFTQLADGKDLWELGEDSYAADTDRLHNDLEAWRPFPVTSEKQIKEIKNKIVRDTPVTCIRAALTVLQVPGLSPKDVNSTNEWAPQQTFCVEKQTGLTLETDQDSERWEITGYSEFGAQRFPAEIRHTKGKQVLLEILVDRYESLGPEKSDVFGPLAGGASSPLCTKMIPPLPARPGGPVDSLFKNALAQQILVGDPVLTLPYDLIVVDVDAAGKATNARAFQYGSRDSISKSDKDKLLKSVFRPATCQGSPVGGRFRLRSNLTVQFR